jgi:hypothetical protein
MNKCVECGTHFGEEDLEGLCYYCCENVKR